MPTDFRSGPRFGPESGPESGPRAGREADPPGLAELIRVFGRIGLLSFGGPAAQIGLMHRELVQTRPWLDEAGFLRALSLCMMLPGPEAMQLATYAGWRLRGRLGGLIAGGLFVLPGALVIAVLVALYAWVGQLPLVQAAFVGVKATVIVIVLQALRNLSGKALKSRADWAVAGLAFVAIFGFGLAFPLIIGAAAAWGWFPAAPAGRTAGAPAPVAIAAAPDRATPWRAAARLLAVWLPLWLGPLIALSLAGPTLLARIGWFFAWLAVVTFGGAYAVLAYMAQTVVDQFGWISTTQMIDALGLAETTPGPLILVTQFVAMLAGQLQGGAGMALAAGAVALWATFVPCFLWIFLAAPHLEALASRPRLGRALQAVTAAVVGVILNLSVWFALNVLFARVSPHPLGPARLPLPAVESFDPRAGALVLLAGWLLVARGFGMVGSLTLCAAAAAFMHQAWP